MMIADPIGVTWVSKNSVLAKTIIEGGGGESALLVRGTSNEPVRSHAMSPSFKALNRAMVKGSPSPVT
jgi:hypothetical protein